VIALDTNVLLRAIVRDDPGQTNRAVEILRQAREDQEAIHVGDVVLCELVWNLRDGYGHKRDDIANVLARVLGAGLLHFESRVRVEQALSAFKAGKGDFADHLILEEARDQNCRALVSFDRKLGRSNPFVILEKGNK